MRRLTPAESGPALFRAGCARGFRPSELSPHSGLHRRFRRAPNPPVVWPARFTPPPKRQGRHAQPRLPGSCPKRIPCSAARVSADRRAGGSRGLVPFQGSSALVQDAGISRAALSHAYRRMRGNRQPRLRASRPAPDLDRGAPKRDTDEVTLLGFLRQRVPRHSNGGISLANVFADRRAVHRCPLSGDLRPNPCALPKLSWTV